MKIKNQLKFSLIGIITFSLTIGIYNIHKIYSINQKLINASSEVTTKIIFLEKLKSSYAEIIESLSSYALLKTESTSQLLNRSILANQEVREFLAAQENIKQQLIELPKTNLYSPGTTTLNPLINSIKETENFGKQIIDSKQNDTFNTAEVLEIKNSLENLEDKFGQIIKQEINREVDILNSNKKLIKESFLSWFLITIVEIFILILLAILITLFLKKQFIKPLHQIQKAFIKVGQGQLETRLEMPVETEWGILAEAFNQMAENLKTTTISQAFFDNILKSMIDALIIVDTNLTIKNFNLAAFLLLKCEQEENLLGISIKNFLDDQKFVNDLENSNLIEHSFLGRKETTLLAQDGTRVPVYFSVSILRDEQEKIQGFVCLVHDLTERKQAEAARQESEEKWRSLVENAPDIIMTVDATGIIQFINDTNPGFSHEKIVGSSAYDYVLPDQRRLLQENFEKVFQTGQPQDYEMTSLSSDGTLACYSTRVSPIFKEDQVVLLTLISRDITERKRMEEALRESEERLESILNKLTDIVWSVSATTFEILYLNPATEKIYGRPLREFFNNINLWNETIHPEDRNKVMEVNKILLSDGIKDVEYRILRPDGEIRWLHDRGRLIRDSNGTPLRLDGIATDITERKNAQQALQNANEELEIRVQERTKAFKQANKRLRKEIIERQLVAEALHQSEERLNSILSSLDDVVWSVDTATMQLLYVSPAVQAIYERSIQEFFENPNLWLEVIHPDDQATVEISTQICFDTGTTDVEYRIFRPSGEVRWLRNRSRVVYDETGTLIRLDGITTDVTNRKQAEVALLASKQRYRAIVEDQTELICRFLPDGQLTFVNDAYCRYFGQSRQELTKQQFQPALFAQTQPLTAQKLQSLSPKNPVISYEYQLKIPTQGTRIQQWTQRGIFNSAGQVVEFQAVGRDMTARKQAEAQRRQSEIRYRNLAKREALLNQLARQIRNSLDLDTILETAVHEIQTLLKIERCFFSWYRQYTQPHTWEIVKEAKISQLPSLLGCYSQPHSTSQTLTNLFNRQLLSISDTQAATDPEVQELYTTWGFISIVALPIETTSGDRGLLSCCQHHEPRTWREGEIKLLQAITDQLALAMNQAALYNHATEAAEAAKEQAQQLQQAMLALQQTQAQLIQTEKMSGLGQMVAGIAHEINNPVSFIYGNIEPALEYIHDLLNLVELYEQHYTEPVLEIQTEIEAIDLEFLREDLPKLLNSMKVGAERIRQIIVSLRNFSRLDEAQMKAVDLHEGIDNTLMILQNRLKSHGNRPAVEIIKDYGKLPLVDCFAGQLNQVFMNLISNAIDAMEMGLKKSSSPNQPRLKIQTKLIENNRVIIQISDNGPGIKSEIQQRIFDPFFTTKPVGSGTGLGLSISYQIVVEKHKGQLICLSEPDAGAIFIIELPVQQDYHEPTIFK